jgi:hypothetical protein
MFFTSIHSENAVFSEYPVFFKFRLVRQPGWLSASPWLALVKVQRNLTAASCGFSGQNPAKPRFLAEVVQKPKFLNNFIIKHFRKK